MAHDLWLIVDGSPEEGQLLHAVRAGVEAYLNRRMCGSGSWTS